MILLKNFKNDIKLDSDNEFISRFEEASGDPIGKEKLEELINNKQFSPENIKLIKGNVFETVLLFLKIIKILN